MSNFLPFTEALLICRYQITVLIRRDVCSCFFNVRVRMHAFSLKIFNLDF